MTFRGQHLSFQPLTQHGLPGPQLDTQGASPPGTPHPVKLFSQVHGNSLLRVPTLFCLLNQSRASPLQKLLQPPRRRELSFPKALSSDLTHHGTLLAFPMRVSCFPLNGKLLEQFLRPEDSQGSAQRNSGQRWNCVAKCCHPHHHSATGGLAHPSSLCLRSIISFSSPRCT